MPYDYAINLRLSQKLREHLDEEAERRGISASELMRALISQSCHSDGGKVANRSRARKQEQEKEAAYAE
jgi:hypothetical protein